MGRYVYPETIETFAGLAASNTVPRLAVERVDTYPAC